MKQAPLIPLELETRSTITTAEAAYHLNRSEQTLRIWSCYGRGPVQPKRVHRRLAWPVAEILAVLQDRREQ